jgi:hypothetical protein
MLTSTVRLGIPPIQLSPVNQSEESRPVQSVSWACGETIDAAKSAIATSHVDKMNLQPVRPREVAPRRVAF